MTHHYIITTLVIGQNAMDNNSKSCIQRGTSVTEFDPTPFWRLPTSRALQSDENKVASNVVMRQCKIVINVLKTTFDGGVFCGNP